VVGRQAVEFFAAANLALPSRCCFADLQQAEEAPPLPAECVKNVAARASPSTAPIASPFQPHRKPALAVGRDPAGVGFAVIRNTPVRPGR
jgi:hypothetical protein